MLLRSPQCSTSDCVKRVVPNFFPFLVPVIFVVVLIHSRNGKKLKTEKSGVTRFPQSTVKKTFEFDVVHQISPKGSCCYKEESGQFRFNEDLYTPRPIYVSLHTSPSLHSF